MGSDNTAPIRLLEVAEALPGVSPLGWDVSHGSPYESYAYDRDGDPITLVATYADGDAVAIGLAFGEGRVLLPPAMREVSGQSEIVYPTPSTQGTSAVLIEGVRGSFDLWVFGVVPDPGILSQDAAWVANGATCPDA